MAGLGAVVLIVIIAVITIKHPASQGAPKSATVPTAKPTDYSVALKKPSTVANVPGHFSLALPDGWSSLAEGSGISAESPDKKIAVDYLRDAALDTSTVLSIMGRDNAKTVKLDGKGEAGGNTTARTFIARAGNVVRMGTLRERPGEVPMFSMLETTADTLKKLSPETINSLLTGNISMNSMAAAPPATPEPQAVAAAQSPAAATHSPLPKPSATPVSSPTQPQPATTPEATLSSTPKTVAEATPAPKSENPAETSAPEQSTAAPEAKTSTTLASNALKISVELPDGWSGKSEEADSMMTIHDPEKMEIRMARDPGKMDPDKTFAAMQQEDWKLVGPKKTKTFSAAQFSKKDNNLLLVLIPEKAGTTLVLYATSPVPFTLPQKEGINLLIAQLRGK